MKPSPLKKTRLAKGVATITITATAAATAAAATAMLRFPGAAARSPPLLPTSYSPYVSGWVIRAGALGSAATCRAAEA